MIGLVLLILFAGLLGWLVYLVALKISKDATIASIVGLVVFLLILFGGWGRTDQFMFGMTDIEAVMLAVKQKVNWNS